MAETTFEEWKAINAPFAPLYSAIEMRTDPEKPLLLAHYTSVAVVEQILRHDEVWFANPLYMNDLEEMQAGLLVGTQLFPEFAKAAGGSDARAQILQEQYTYFFQRMTAQHVLDTYVFCLSEHSPDDSDGKLSMWREYGSKGNGAALVFNTARINYLPHSPLIVAKVAYKTRQERLDAIRQTLTGWASTTQASKLPDDRLYIASHVALTLLTSLALTTKHKGFQEEAEWRVVYLAERDSVNYFKSCKSYFVGPRGVEPKLKLKFGVSYHANGPGAPEGPPPPPVSAGNLADIVEFILLGPTTSSPLAQAAFQRMLEGVKPELVGKVLASSIPLRPSS